MIHHSLSARLFLLSTLFITSTFSSETNPPVPINVATTKFKNLLCAEYKTINVKCPDKIINSSPWQLYHHFFNEAQASLENTEYGISVLGKDIFWERVGDNMIKAGAIAVLDLNKSKSGLDLMQLGCKSYPQHQSCSIIAQIPSKKTPGASSFMTSRETATFVTRSLSLEAKQYQPTNKLTTILKRSLVADYKSMKVKCPNGIVNASPSQLYRHFYDEANIAIANKNLMVSKTGEKGFREGVGNDMIKAGAILFVDFKHIQNGLELMNLGCTYYPNHQVCTIIDLTPSNQKSSGPVIKTDQDLITSKLKESLR